MAQTLTEIRAMLQQAGLRPLKQLGQNFLIDHNLLAAVVDLAAITPGDVVLEVGPGTGTLTDELLATGARVLAVELDAGLARLLERRYASNESLTLLHADILAGKHALNGEVLAAMGELTAGPVKLVSNLPYNVAVPVVCECLVQSAAARRSVAGGGRFDSLTITVQREVALRLAAPAGSGDYGPASVLVALLGEVHLGKRLGPQAFWPRPKVESQMLRIDAIGANPEVVPDIPVLRQLLNWAFGHRRKRIGSRGRFRQAPWPPERIEAALAAAEIDPGCRPEMIEPARFAKMAAALSVPG